MLDDLMNVIDSNTTASVWCDYVPESETQPAIAITNLANGKRRDLAGTFCAVTSFWRLTVVASKTDDVISLVEQLEKLDNTIQTGFQKMLVDYVLMEPKQPRQNYRRAFVDVKLYK